MHMAQPTVWSSSTYIICRTRFCTIYLHIYIMKFSKKRQILRVPYLFPGWNESWCFFPLQIYRIRQIFRCKHVTDVKEKWCLKSNINHFPPFWRTRCRWRMWCGQSIRSVWEVLDCQRDDMQKRTNSNFYHFLRQNKMSVETWSPSHIPLALILDFCDNSASLAWWDRTESVDVQQLLELWPFWSH